MGPSDRDDESCVIAGHFTLTDEQLRFKAMLAEHPRLMPYWDFMRRECDFETLRPALGARRIPHGIVPLKMAHGNTGNYRALWASDCWNRYATMHARRLWRRLTVNNNGGYYEKAIRGSVDN